MDASHVPSQQIWTIFYNIKLSSNQSQNDKKYMTNNFIIKAARRKYLTTKNTLTQNLLIFAVSSNGNCLMTSSADTAMGHCTAYSKKTRQK